MSDRKGWGSTVLGWFVVQGEDSGAAEGAAAEFACSQCGTPHDKWEPQCVKCGSLATVSASAAAAAAKKSPPPPAAEPAAAPSAKSPAAKPAPAPSKPSGKRAPAAAAAPEPQFFRTEPPAAVDGHIDFDAVFDAAGVDEEERGRVARAIELVRNLPPGTEFAVQKQIVEASLKAFGVAIDKIIEDGVSEIQALEGYIRAGAGETQKLLESSDVQIVALEAEIRKLAAAKEEKVALQQAVARACNEKKLEVQRVLEFFGQEAVAKVVRDSPKLHEPSQAAQSGNVPTSKRS